MSTNRILLVEGSDDKKIFDVLCKKLGITGIEIISYDGKPKLEKKLIALKKSPGFNSTRALGITRDADEENVPDIFNEIKSQLTAISLPTPKELGVFTMEKFSPHKPNTGVFIFPDCKEPGELENLILNSLMEHPHLSCVDNFFNCIQQKLAVKKTAKMQFYAWLASLNPPMLRLEEAVHQFEFNHSAFARITQFIKSLASTN